MRNEAGYASQLFRMLATIVAFDCSLRLRTSRRRAGRGDIPPAITTPDKVETRIGTLEFKDGAPSAETVQKVYDSLDFVRGVDAFMNSFSGASAYAIRKGFQSIGAEDNTVVIFSELMDANSLFLTANADTIYTVAILDLTKGPLVVEVPPMALGTINDMWFGWIIDIGLPGPDRGEGGKYLIVPPGYDGPLPDSGFHVGRSKTTHVLYAVRAFMENNDPKPPSQLIKKTLKIYPYTPGGFGTSIATALEGKVRLAAQPADPADEVRRGERKVVQHHPPERLLLFRDGQRARAAWSRPPRSSPELLGQLAAIGIVKGKPFKPDARMKKILTDAAAVGNAAGRALNWRAAEYPGWAYYPGSMWANMLWQGGYNFETPPPMVTKEGIQAVPADRRADPRLPDGVLLRLHDGLAGHDHAAAQRRLAVPHGLHGCRQESLRWRQDLQGDPAAEHSRGASSGRSPCTTTRPAPCSRRRSATRAQEARRTRHRLPWRTRTAPRRSISAQPSPPARSDGNWIQTMPGKGWFTLLRLYSPQESFFTRRGGRARSSCSHELRLARMRRTSVIQPERMS